MRFAFVLLGLVGCGVEARVCNDTGKDMTQLRWGNTEETPLRAGSCTGYQSRDDGSCALTYVDFIIDGVSYSPHRIDCYDHDIDDGPWTIHVTIRDEAMHDAGINMEHD
jgi:hypothetical protein